MHQTVQGAAIYRSVHGGEAGIRTLGTAFDRTTV